MFCSDTSWSSYGTSRGDQVSRRYCWSYCTYPSRPCECMRQWSNHMNTLSCPQLHVASIVIGPIPIPMSAYTLCSIVRLTSDGWRMQPSDYCVCLPSTDLQTLCLIRYFTCYILYIHDYIHVGLYLTTCVIAPA